MRTRARTLSPFTLAFFGVTVVFFGAFLFYPLWFEVSKVVYDDGRFQFGFAYIWRNAIFRESLVNSLILGLVVTAATTALALPLAMITTRYSFPGRAWLSSLLLVPMIMPPFVGAIGIKRLLAERGGALNVLLANLGLIDLDHSIDWLGSGFWGVVVLEVLHLYPIMYLNVTAALSNVDPSMEEAARSLGDSGFRLFRRITFPLLAPGYFAGAAIVFIWAFTDLGTPLIFNFDKVAAVQIYRNLSGDNPAAYALVAAILIIAVALFYGSKWLFTRHEVQMLSKGMVAGQEKPLSGRNMALAYAFLLGVTFIALLPHISVMLTAIAERWNNTVLPESYTWKYFHDVFTRSRTYNSILNSFFYSITATVLDIVLGVAIAFLVVRYRVWGSSVMDTMAMLPLAIPGIVVAFGYVTGFSNTIIDPRVNPTILLIIAYAVRRLPYMVRSAVAGLQQTSEVLEEASLNLGASPATTVRRIVLPLVMANVIAGSILCFSFAMLEVSDSIILAMKENYYPITKAILMTQQEPPDGAYVACAFGVLGMVLLTISLLAAGRVLGKKMGSLFRV